MSSVGREVAQWVAGWAERGLQGRCCSGLLGSCRPGALLVGSCHTVCHDMPETGKDMPELGNNLPWKGR